MLQIEEIINLCAAAFEDKNKDPKVNPKLLRLTLSDGTSCISAMVYQYINGLNLETPIGSKIIIKDAYVRRGYLMLTNGNTKLLNGFADIESAEEEKKQNAQNNNGSNPSNVRNQSNRVQNQQVQNQQNQRNIGNAPSHSDNRPPANDEREQSLIHRVRGMQMDRNRNNTGNLMNSMNSNNLNPVSSSNNPNRNGNANDSNHNINRRSRPHIEYDELPEVRPAQPINNSNIHSDSSNRNVPLNDLNRNQNNQRAQHPQNAVNPQIQRHEPPRKLTQKEKLCGFGDNQQKSVFIPPTAVMEEQKNLRSGNLGINKNKGQIRQKSKRNSWSCPMCTFANSGTDVCEICGFNGDNSEDKENRGNVGNDKAESSDSDDIEILNQSKVKKEKGNDVFDDLQCDDRDFTDLNFSNRLQHLNTNSSSANGPPKSKKKFR